jgi:hypothetical protein
MRVKVEKTVAPNSETRPTPPVLPTKSIAFGTHDSLVGWPVSPPLDRQYPMDFKRPYFMSHA